MSDKVGFVITLPGYAVENAIPENCAIHSSYDTFKMQLSTTNPQFGNITVNFVDNPVPGTYVVATLYHGYGYIPAYYMFYDIRTSSTTLSQEVGNSFALDALSQSYFSSSIDSQNVYFNFIVVDTGALNVTGNTYNFRYYIFANNGL